MSDASDPKAIFTCQKCGECCRGYGGTFVTDADIQIISEYLNIDPKRFLRDCCQLSGGKAVLAQGKSDYCIFWDKLCTIHPVKPEMCKKWPFIESLLTDIKNWHAMASSCAGIQTDLPDRQIKKYVKKMLSRDD